MYEILVNILIFCGILLLIALVVTTVQGILILVDVRRTTKQVTKKLLALTSALDIIGLFLGGMEGAKKRIHHKFNPEKSTFVAFAAGLKKGLQVLLNKEEEGGEKNGKDI